LLKLGRADCDSIFEPAANHGGGGRGANVKKAGKALKDNGLPRRGRLKTPSPVPSPKYHAGRSLSGKTGANDWPLNQANG